MTKSFIYSVLSIIMALGAVVTMFIIKDDLGFWAMLILSNQYAVLRNQYRSEEAVHNAIKSLCEEDEP